MIAVTSQPAVRAGRSVGVPFLDLGAIHRSLKDEILADIARLVDSNAFANGPAVNEFEAAFAQYCGTTDCIGLASGLDALRLGLMAAGLAPGDGVIVPAQTFIATYEAVTQAGGRPVVVDVTERDYTMDVAAVGRVAAEGKFVIPVHLYGQLVDVTELRRVVDATGLVVIEDACQSHGAVRGGARPGSLGPAAFSFYPGKNLGAFGDAGALVVDDPDIAARARALREHGQRSKYRHELIGYTARLDTIQALVLLRKLPFLDQWNAERRAAAAFYADALAGVGDLRLPPVPTGSEPVWHLYVARTANPDALAEFLRARDIGTARHYPEPPHLSPAYRALGYGHGDFPVAEALAKEGLSLPIFPGITEQQLEAVALATREFFASA